MSHVTSNRFDTADFLATEGSGRSILRHVARAGYLSLREVRPMPSSISRRPGKAYRRVQERKRSNGYAACLGRLFWRGIDGRRGSAAHSTASAVSVCMVLRIEASDGCSRSCTRNIVSQTSLCISF